MDTSSFTRTPTEEEMQERNDRMERQKAETDEAVSSSSSSDSDGAVRLMQADPFGRHRWVELKDLNRTELNGKYAEIIKQVDNSEDDRFAVRVKGSKKAIAIKRINLGAIPDEETVKVCRISARGEEIFEGGFVQTVRWPTAILQALPSSHLSAVSARLGIPLRIAKVTPRSKLSSQGDYDNQWATFMMIELRSGFAPPEWLSYVGPVVVWRDGCTGDVSADDMWLLNVYLKDLLDSYSDGEVSPQRDITPQAWVKAKKSILIDCDYKDINI